MCDRCRCVVDGRACRKRETTTTGEGCKQCLQVVVHSDVSKFVVIEARPT